MGAGVGAVDIRCGGGGGGWQVCSKIRDNKTFSNTSLVASRHIRDL